MFFLLKTLNSLIKLLNSETAPSQLSAGMTFGMLVGLSPFLSLHNLFIFMIVCLFRVNFSMFFMSLAFFSILGFFGDPIFDRLGYWLLVDFTSLRPFWISITTGAIWPFFNFNNTIVMGSLGFGLLLFVPLFVAGIHFIKIYRSKWREQIQKSALVKSLKATPLYGVYLKYENFRNRLSAFS